MILQTKFRGEYTTWGVPNVAAKLVLASIIRGRFKIHRHHDNGLLTLKTPNGFMTKIRKEDIKFLRASKIIPDRPPTDFSYAISC